MGIDPTLHAWRPHVEASLLAKAVDQPHHYLYVATLSRAASMMVF